MTINDKVILTSNADGSTSVQRQSDGEFVGKLPSPQSRQAPTASPHTTLSAGEIARRTQVGGSHVSQEEEELVEMLYMDDLPLETKIMLASDFTSQSLLITLARSYHEIRPVVASNPHASASTLKELLLLTNDSDNPWDVSAVKGISLHPNTSRLVFAYLALHPDSEVRSNIASHKNISPLTLEQLAVDESELVRLAVAQNPNAFPHTLLAMTATGNTSQIIEAALTNPSYDHMASRKYANLPQLSAGKLEDILGDKEASPALLDSAANTVYLEYRIQVAEHLNTSGQTLKRLAKDDSAAVLKAVASSGNLLEETAFELGKNFDPEIRVAIARRKDLYGSSPALDEIFSELARDPEPMVRETIARNNQLPSSILDSLVNDDSESVRSELASNPAASDDVLLVLANDPSSRVRQQLCLGNNRASSEMIANAWNYSEPLWNQKGMVGVAALAHSNTSKEVKEDILNFLLTHDEEYMAKTSEQDLSLGILVAKNSAATPEIFERLLKEYPNNKKVLARIKDNASSSEDIKARAEDLLSKIKTPIGDLL